MEGTGNSGQIGKDDGDHAAGEADDDLEPRVRQQQLPAVAHRVSTGERAANRQPAHEAG